MTDINTEKRGTQMVILSVMTVRCFLDNHYEESGRHLMNITCSNFEYTDKNRQYNSTDC